METFLEGGPIVDIQIYGEALELVSLILKREFPNLTVDKTIKLAREITTAVVTIKEDS